MHRRTARIAVWVAAGTFLLRADGRGLSNPDEGRYAEIARAMVATGDPLVPRLHGTPHWAKPPLVYWLSAASLRAFGPVDWAARLPTILAGAAATFFVAGAARRALAGAPAPTAEAAGAAAAIVFASSLQIAAVGSLLTTDMLQTAAAAAALGPLLRLWTMKRAEAARAGGERLRLAARVGLALGLAFVAKGPVLLGVVAAAYVVHVAIDRERRTPSFGPFALGAALVAAVGLPWFMAVCEARPGLAAHYLGHEVRDRVATQTHGREQAWWYFPALFPLGLVPWTGAFVAAARGRAAAPADARLRRALLAWVAGGFVLFQMSGSKLPTYLAPLFPAAAALVGVDLARRAAGARGGASGAAWTAVGLAVVCAGAAFIAAHRGLPTVLPGVAAAAIAALGAAATIRLRARGPLVESTLAAGVVFALLFVAHRSADLVEPWARSPSSRAALGREVARLGLRGDPMPTALTAAATPAPPTGGPPQVVAFRRVVNSLPFYAFGLRPETLTTYDAASLWEMKDDVAADRGKSAEDLAARLRSGPLHVVVRSSDLAALGALSPRTLTTLAADGEGRAELLLVRAD